MQQMGRPYPAVKEAPPRRAGGTRGIAGLNTQGMNWDNRSGDRERDGAALPSISVRPIPTWEPTQLPPKCGMSLGEDTTFAVGVPCTDFFWGSQPSWLGTTVA